MTSKIEDGVKDSNLVIEAIVENLKAKWELFSTVEKLAPRDAVYKIILCLVYDLYNLLTDCV